MKPVQHDKTPRRRLPAAQRRESILAAAATVFAVAGYSAAKVSDIAAQVGVTEPVVFQNFGSKPALFTAVLDRAAAQARASLEHSAARFGSAGGLLAHVLGHFTVGHDAHAAPPGALFAAAVALASDPAAPQVPEGALRALAGHIADIVRRGQLDGSVRRDVDPEATSWLLVSVLAADRLRANAMPAGLEPAVAELAARLLIERVQERLFTPPERPRRYLTERAGCSARVH